MSNNSLNIIHIITSPQGGGAELLVREINRQLLDDNINSEAVYFTNPDNLKLQANEYCLNLDSPRSINAIISLRNYIKSRLKYNSKIILHSHLSWPLYYTVISTIGFNCKLVYTEHSTYNKRREYKILKNLEKIIYRQYDKVICISEGVKQSLNDWLNDKHIYNKYRVIYNGSRLFNKKPSRRLRTDNKISVISIGSLAKHKGFHISIRAISQIRSQIHKYHIIGEGPERESLDKLIQKYDLSDIVELHGWVDNVEPYLHDSDISIIPSLWEGFGLVAIESLSAGLPVIASNVPGLNEIFGEEDCPAILIERGNVSELIQAIQVFQSKLIKGIDYRHTAITCANKFSLERMMGRYALLYREISEQ